MVSVIAQIKTAASDSRDALTKLRKVVNGKDTPKVPPKHKPNGKGV